MANTIFVSGATGNMGKEVVKQLVAKGARVRAGVHSKEKAGILKETGAEVVSVDLNNVKSVQTALEGVEKAFSLSPLVPNLAELSANFVKAAKLAGVKYIVRASGMGADSPQAITLGRWHREAEKTVESSGIAYTLIRPNSFMQNYINFAAHTIKSQNAFYFPQGDGKVSLIDVRDIAAVVVALLTKGGHEGKAYTLTGPEAVSNYQIAAILSRVTGRTINYVDVPEAAARQGMKEMGMPETIIEALLELYTIVKAGYTGAVSPAVEQITGRPPLSFEQFAKDHILFFK
ncbi:MAG: SDR family oxidoreductase [Nitrospirae bacterium]|nr:SDR family oxidoreductase [Nitrospirota bacterium]